MADVCTLFGKSDDTIRRWVNEGTFPPPGHLSQSLDLDNIPD